MNQQITRLSPHQNGKVFGILVAVVAIPFVVPLFLFWTFMSPLGVDRHGNEVSYPAFIFLLFPFLYLISGYISVAIGCAIYNFLFRYIGGFEFESQDKDA